MEFELKLLYKNRFTIGCNNQFNKYSLNGNNWRFNDELNMFVDIPANIGKPDIITNIQSEIGNCDDLILDARSTINLCGIDNAVYKWYIYDLIYILMTLMSEHFVFMVTFSIISISETFLIMFCILYV